MDVCGVCHGKNTTCTDCDGVVLGKKKLDVCGKCLQETDPRFNVTCGPKIVKVSQIVIKAGQKTKVKAYGTGLKSYSKVYCDFEPKDK